MNSTPQPHPAASPPSTSSRRSRSIRRNLMWRMLLACVVAAVVVGTGTYLLERQRIAADIEERARRGVDLLRASVRQLAHTRGDSWQQALPQALSQLAQDVREDELGRFTFVEVLAPDGRRLASAEDASAAPLVALARQRGFKADAEGLELVALRDSPVRGAVAVAAPVAGRQGERLAQINAVFLVSAQTIASAERDVARAVLTALAIVVATTLLIYPLIRRLVQRLSELSMRLLDANLATLQVLGDAIAKRDSDTDAHNYRVTIYAVKLAEACALDGAAMRRLIKGAFLHDVGKIGVRDHILLKPGRLDADEFEIMKSHVPLGLEIIARADWLRDAGEVIGGHHEKYAGAGYQAGLQREAIPLGARIFAIADVFDALTSERPYKQPMSVEASLAILQRDAGQHFDPVLVARFEAMAVDLHARFAGDYEAARLELQAIVERCFKADLGVILDEPGLGT